MARNSKEHTYRLMVEAKRGVMALRDMVHYLGRERCSGEAFGSHTFHATLTSAQRKRFTQWLYRHPVLPDDVSIKWFRIDPKKAKT